MAGNKVDNSKKKKVTMKDRQSEEGKRLIKEYGGPKTFNREQLYQHMQKKIAENQLAQEYASQNQPLKNQPSPREQPQPRG